MAFDTYNPDNYRNTRWLLTWEFTWLGFTARGHDLSHYGWSAELLKHEVTYSSYIVLHNREQKVQFMSSRIDDYDMRDMRHTYTKMGYLPIGLKSCAQEHRMMINSMAPPFKVETLDLNPRELTYKDICIGDLFPKFMQPEEKRIIIPEDPTVDELLAKIIAKQQPGQVEYFNNKVKNREVPEAKMMGQIIQLRA